MKRSVVEAYLPLTLGFIITNRNKTLLVGRLPKPVIFRDLGVDETFEEV